MTLDIEPEEGQALAGEAGADDVALTPAARLAGYMRGGGIVVPLLTVVFAFFLRSVLSERPMSSLSLIRPELSRRTNLASPDRGPSGVSWL